MDNQFDEILDNLDEEEVKEEQKESVSKKDEEIVEEKEEIKANVRFRLFMVLLFIAIAMLGVLITQIVLFFLIIHSFKKYAGSAAFFKLSTNYSQLKNKKY